MVNDFRCHLANLPPTESFSAGEVYVPRSYTPRILDRAEQTIRTALFGMRPDRHMINYRCFQLLRILHASDWREAVTASDARLTYDPWVWPGAHMDWSRVNVIYAPTDLLLIGQILPNDVEGITLEHYEILVTAADTVTIFRSGTRLNEVTFALSGGTTAAMPLGASGLSFMFNTVPDIDSRFILEFYRKPEFSLGDIEMAVHTGADSGALSTIFAAGDENSRALASNLWQRSRSTQSRLCGLTIGLVNYARTRS